MDAVPGRRDVRADRMDEALEALNDVMRQVAAEEGVLLRCVGRPG
jgi:hypothetical protein